MKLDFRIRKLVPPSLIWLIIILPGMSCSTNKSQVRIDNLGKSSLNSVTVRVREISHDLGQIAADQSKSVIVEPGGESSLEIELTNDQGERKTLVTDFRLEADYRGFILVRIENDLIVHAEKDHFVSWY